MVKNSLIMGATVLLSSCVFFRHPIKLVDGQPIHKREPKYKLVYELDTSGLQLIDPNAVYRYDVPQSSPGPISRYIKLDSDGGLVRLSKFDNEPLTIYDIDKIHPKSMRRGRYKLYKKNRIKLEQFYPSEPMPFVDGWFRHFSKGYIVGDTIKIKHDNGYYDYILDKNWKK